MASPTTIPGASYAAPATRIGISSNAAGTRRCFICNRSSASIARLRLHSRAPTYYLKACASRSSVMATSTEMQGTVSVGSEKSPLQMTYLEGNSWLWEVAGVKVLVDPVLVGNLDFGISWLYDGAKRTLKDFKLEDLPKIDCLLITQSLDDHCHKNTLEPLSEMVPDLPVIATKNAESKLSKLFKKVTYLEPGESTTFAAESGQVLKITASTGPVLGPPWQRPENGYFIETEKPKLSLYYEPHCISKLGLFKDKTVDVFVTPVIKQTFPFYTLVSGQEDAVELAKILQPKYIVTMKNGDLDTKGMLSMVVSQVGTTDAFKSLLSKVLPDTQVLEPEPGTPFDVPVAVAS